MSLSGTFRFLPRFVVHRSTEDVRDTVFFCISFIMRWCWFCHLHILLLFPFINVTSTCTHTETLLYSFRCCVFTKKQRIFFHTYVCSRTTLQNQFIYELRSNVIIWDGGPNMEEHMTLLGFTWNSKSFKFVATWIFLFFILDKFYWWGICYTQTLIIKMI